MVFLCYVSHKCRLIGEFFRTLRTLSIRNTFEILERLIVSINISYFPRSRNEKVCSMRFKLDFVHVYQQSLLKPPPSEKEKKLKPDIYLFFYVSFFFLWLLHYNGAQCRI